MTERNEDPVRPAAGPGGTQGRWIPALLTVVVPGLGHAAAGRRRLAVLYGLPVVFALFFAVGLAFALGTTGLLGLALDDGFIAVFLGLQALLLAWRLLALRSSLTDPRAPRLRARDALPIALLVLAVVVPQAYAGYVTNAERQAVDEIVAGGQTTTGAWKPSFTPSPLPTPAASLVAGETPAPATASPSPSPAVPRINILLIGVDAGVGRNTYLTDTMIVASIDPVAGTVSLLSIPRDLVDVPLPDGRKWSGKINSLLAYARNHPNKFPGSDGSGHDVLMAAIGTLLRIEIDYYAQVNLAGFVAVVDRLGGVDVNVARPFCDPGYDEYGFTRGFSITAGRHHLNGNQALAYARVRKAAGESDFSRAARQQEVLSGIRDAVVKGRFLGDPVGFLQALSRTVETNVPRKRIAEAAALAARIDRAHTYRVVLGGKQVSSGYDARGYILIGDLPAIRDLAAQLFPPTGTLPNKRYLVPKAVASRASGSGVSGCLPAPTPRPTAKPTPRPTPKPAATPTPTSEPTPTPTPEPTPTPTPEPTPASEPPSAP